MPLNDQMNLAKPAKLRPLVVATDEAGFTMACELTTGSLLRTLAATKRGGAFLEIGTGTGVGSCWILDGMDATSTLITVEREQRVSDIARRNLSDDERIEFVSMDAEDYLKTIGTNRFDFIFADTFPGKFLLLDEALAALKVGGLYIVDDLLPQPNWAANHQANVDRLIAELENRRDLILTKLNWASGLIVATKIVGQ